jgi:geranylgeranyl diphosphate synthase, type II
MTDLQEFFAKNSQVVENELDRLVPSENVEPVRLHQALRWSLFAGGKRLRPVLLIAAGRIFGAEDRQLARTAAAVEMIHTYSLIHDDLPSMDNDDMRRGRETCHKRFGEATAILAGDVLETLAFGVIAEDENLPSELRVRLITEFTKAAGTPWGMVAGQQMDLEAEGREISLKELNAIHHRKTGSLITASGKAGAMIGGGTDDEIRTIEKYSSLLGLLFQITDDILDVTQSSESLGKTAGKDVRTEKATYPRICGLEDAHRLAREVHDEAVATLEGFGRPCDLLRQMARYILARGA